MAKTKNNKLSMLSSKRNISILLIVIIAAFGAWRVFLSGASPNNCQPEKGVNICDIDQVQGNVDNILSNGPEAQNLGKDSANWPLYLGTAFRAPTSSLDGAQPVYRVFNSSVSWHDYMLEAGKKDKEAKSPGKVANEGIAFYAWPSASRAGLVPVYRLTQSGGTTKVIFTTDRAWRDKLVAADINNSEGWKDGGIPFYAFPPTYKAIATDGKPQANPYDCSIKENFVSDRCTASRTNLATAVASGNIAASNDCPATLVAYNNEPFPSRFPQVCQDKWNKELSNCSVKENFVSDRCKDVRAAFEKAEEERIARENAERQAAVARQNTSTGSGRSSGSGGGSRGGGSGGSGGSTGGGSNGIVDCSKLQYYSTNECKAARDNLSTALYYGGLPPLPPGGAGFNNNSGRRSYKCVVTYTLGGGFGLGRLANQQKRQEFTITAINRQQAYNTCLSRFKSQFPTVRGRLVSGFAQGEVSNIKVTIN